MENTTSNQAPSKHSQRLLTLVGVLLMLVVLLYTQVAHVQVTSDRIKMLKALATGHNPYGMRMTLGRLHADAGEYDKAVEWYRSALPYYRSKLDERLALAWEALDQEDPFDPKMHIGFGEMFQRFGALKQAEMEYKQALSIAREDKEAASKLADIAALELLAKPDPRTANPDVVLRDKKYGPDLAAAWLPPAHQDCLITRCSVFSDIDGHTHIIVVGQSGSSQHDRSAVNVLQAANFGDLFYFHKAGVFDFGCMSEGGIKTIAFTEVGGECNFVETAPIEQLSWQGQEILKRINKQIGALRL